MTPEDFKKWAEDKAEKRYPRNPNKKSPVYVDTWFGEKQMAFVAGAISAYNLLSKEIEILEANCKIEHDGRIKELEDNLKLSKEISEKDSQIGALNDLYSKKANEAHEAKQEIERLKGLMEKSEAVIFEIFLAMYNGTKIEAMLQAAQ
jgi:hypothetical protein